MKTVSELVGRIVEAFERRRENGGYRVQGADMPIPHDVMCDLMAAYRAERQAPEQMNDLIRAALREAVVSGRGADAVSFQTLMEKRGVANG